MGTGGRAMSGIIAASAIALVAVLGSYDQSSAERGAGEATELTSVAAPEGAGEMVDVISRGSGGYWLIGADGGVFSYEGAPFLGSAGDVELAEPIVAAMGTPSGLGYWLVGSDGGVLSFGDARFRGSLGNFTIDAPIVAAVATSTGAGYWLFASDGGVFAFGDAGFFGSLGHIALDEPIVDAAGADDDAGYLMISRDGGAFAFGSVQFPGSAVGLLGPAAAVAVSSASDTTILTNDGTAWMLKASSAIRSGALGVESGHMVLARDGDVVMTGKPSRSLTIGVSGDVLPHASVQRSAWTPDGYDFTSIFEGLRPVLDKIDLSLCHLETVISSTDRDLSSYPRFRAPAAIASGLAEAGYDGCSTSSNHALDFGLDGVRTTIEALDAAGLGHAGTAATEADRRTHQSYEVNGVSVAHLSYSYGFNGSRDHETSPWAANLITHEQVLADAADARSLGADFVIVSLHWGLEYYSRATTAQIEMAEAILASTDVDVIVGHHAHVVQPIAMVGDEYVIYGLGNSLSSMVTPARRDGVVVTLDISEGRDGSFSVVGVSATPTWVDRPHAVIVAEPDGPYGSSWRRTMRTLRSMGVEIEGYGS